MRGSVRKESVVNTTVLQDPCQSPLISFPLLSSLSESILPVNLYLELFSSRGASCSGKTTLAKHLRRILPGDGIIHLDDFATPPALAPIHPVYGVIDYDSPAESLQWDRLVSFLRKTRASGGEIPQDHQSHDPWNEQKEATVSSAILEKWTAEFRRVGEERERVGEEITWVILEGFVLYWNREVADQIDVPILLRAPHDVLRQRRQERPGFRTPEGEIVADPPNYWEQIVWPAYIEAHTHIFEDGNWENGASSGTVEDLLIIDEREAGITRAVNEVCQKLKQVAYAW